MRNFLILLPIFILANCAKMEGRKVLHFVPLFFDSEEISIRYPQANYNLEFGSPTEIKPILKGTVSSCSSSENLPLGLNLSSECIIYGIPLEIVNKKTYTITARHFFQSKSTEIQITVAQPISISYPSSTYVLGLGGSYTISPNVNGTIQSCEISPSLPSGLSLQNNCSIVGIPIVLSSPTTYTVTASNPTSSATTTLIIEVKNLPSVSFAQASDSGLESVGSVNIPVSLSFTENAIINYILSGTSTEGSDYTISGSLVFTNGGPTTQNLTLSVIDDTLYENNETVIITLNIVSGAIAGTHMTYTYTIQNNDSPPQVSFNTSTSSISENGITANIQIDLSTISGLDVTVPITINTSSTATNSSDYSLPLSSVTIPAGSTTANVVVNIVDDPRDEDDETIILDLGTPSNATLGAITTHTLTILDNDPPPTVEFANASSSGLESSIAVNLTVVLSSVSEKTVSVNYATNNGTALAGTDYTSTSGTLTFPPGTTSQTIIVNVTNDSMYEANETFFVTLSTPTNAGLGTNTTHTYTIMNDDTAPTVEFNVASQSVNENIGTATVTIQQSAVSGLDSTVNFTIETSSTATGGGTDYSYSPSSPVTILAGSTSINLSFTIVNDTLYENDETIVIKLSSATNASLGTINLHTLTIQNDDPLPQVSFTSGTSVSFSEAVGTYGLALSLDTASGLPVTVTLNTADGTATAGSDYTAVVSQVITIPAGITSFTYPISITNDLLTEGSENFTITMSSPVNSTITGGATQTATILDNEIAITSALTIDCDGNGKIDHYRLQFVNDITDSTFPGYIANSLGSVTSDWLVAGYSNVRLHHGTSFTCGTYTDTANDNTIYLKFDEGTTYDTGAKPDVTTSSNPLASGPSGTVGIIYTATLTETDGARPVVTSITPNNGATGVMPSSYVQVEFSEDMNTATFNTTNFTVTGSMSVTGTVSTIDSKTPRFTPTSSLEYNQSHTVTINNMQDLAGNTNVPFTSGFTTAPKNRVIGNIAGLGSLTMTLGVSVNGGSPTSIVSTTLNYASGYILANGNTYELTILSQPEGKVCAILSNTTPAAGTFTGYTDLNLDVNCVDGYLLSNRIQTDPPEPIDIRLYRGEYVSYYGSTSGYADGTSPKFNSNRGIVIAKDYGYIADAGNKRIRRMDTSGNTITIAGDGTSGNLDSSIGTNAKFEWPFGLATDGTYLYVTDVGNHNIRRIRLNGSYEVSTIAGSTSGDADGVGTAAKFNEPRSIALDENFLYVGDFNNKKIKKIKLSTKQVTTLSTLSVKPLDLTLVANDIYVVCDDYKIYKVNKTTGTSTVFAGIDSTSGSHDGKSPNFDFPTSIMSDGTNLFVFDKNISRIRKVRISDKYTSTIAGSEYTGTDTLGFGINAGFTTANSITSDGKNLYLSVSNKIAKVRDLGLNAYFPLRRGLSDYARDRSIAATSTSFTSTSRYGISNEAFTFDGSNYLFLSDLTGIPTSNNTRTLCAWVNIDKQPTSGGIFTIISYGDPSSDKGSELIYYEESGSHYLALSKNGATASNLRKAAYKLSLYTWTHVCGRYDGSTVKIYVNGRYTSTDLGSITFQTQATNSDKLVIGSQSNIANYFSGKIDEVLISNHALEDTTIQGLASQILIGLVARYDFNGDSQDVSGYGNHLTNSGGPSLSLDRFGNNNSSYNFNGSNQYFHVTSTPLPFSSDSGKNTVCAWIRANNTAGVRFAVSYGTSFQQVYIGGKDFDLSGLMKGGRTLDDWNATAILPPFTWNHVCSVFDNGNTTLYQNGKVVKNASTGSWNISPTVLNIGRSTSADRYFDGQIDEVVIYNRVLTGEEIRALSGYHYMQVSTWNSTVASSSLKAAYRSERISNLSNGDSVPGIKDLSGNNYNLIPTGTVKYYTNQFGNLGGISFETTNGNLQKNSVTFNTNNYTVFSVQRLGSSDPTERVILSLKTLSDEVQIRTTGNPNYKIKICTAVCGAITPTNLVDYGFIVTKQQNTTQTKSYTNGGHLNTGISLSLLTGSPTLTLGNNHTTDKNFVGKIGELYLWDGDLSSSNPNYSGFSDREIMECFLAQKNQIVLNHSCP